MKRSRPVRKPRLRVVWSLETILGRIRARLGGGRMLAEQLPLPLAEPVRRRIGGPGGGVRDCRSG